jgi:peptidoglycan/LPS O-acetylase OafA/YrhL
MQKAKNIDLLTTLRFFAAAWVFFDHFGKDILVGAPLMLNRVLPHGRMAVTFFFILSGFVLTYSNSPNGKLFKPASQFMLARFARIYPVYFFALLIPLPHKLWGLLSGHENKADFLALPFVLTLSQAWFPHLADAWNPPAWSLSVEAFFYICFPLLVPFCFRFRPSILLWGSIMLLVAGESFRAVLMNCRPELAEFFPLMNLPQFIFGGMLVFVSAIAVVYYLICSQKPSIFLLPLAAVAFGAIIYSSAVLSGHSLNFMTLPFFVLLGESSYAFYIIHMPGMVGFQRFMGLLGVLQPAKSETVLFTGFVFCTIFSIGTHLLLEKPARRWILGSIEKRSDNLGDSQKLASDES